MKKRITAFVLVVLVLFSMVACTNPSGQSASSDTQTTGTDSSQEQDASVNDGKIKLGFIFSTLNNPFFVYMRDNVQDECDTLGIELVVMDSQDNTERELKNIEDMISKQVDVLILVPMDSEASANGIRLCNEANIPVITVDRQVEGADIVTQLSSDNFAGGKLAGEHALEAIENKGNIAILRGYLGIQLETERFEGFVSVVESESDVQIVAEQVADFDRNKAFEVMENILQAQPDIQLVYALNDEMALGAFKALEAAKRTDVKVIGFDGSQECLLSIKEGRIYGTVFQQFDLIGRKAVQIANDVVAGNTEGIPALIPVEVSFATLKNVDELMY